MKRFALCALTWIAAGVARAAQPPQSQPEPESPQTTSAARTDYLLPDLPSEKLVLDGERVWVRPVIALLGDYTSFDQNESSVAQVGRQDDTTDLRAARFGVLVRPQGGGRWEAYFATDYQEERTREDDTFQLYDLRFRIRFDRVNLDLGKQKQPFSAELLGLSLLNPQQERILSPFFVTRSIGALASGQFAGDRMTWAAGWYNDWLESGATFSDNASDYVGRVTGLVSASPDNLDYFHLGLALRRVGPDAGMVRLSGRPESNVTDKYVDTGEFDADYTGQIGLEALLNRGPFTLMAEHVEARAHAPASGDPHFTGSYLLFSWMVTGESRPYNRTTGFAGGITPTGRSGAIEIVARYSHIDLTDGPIDGGVLRKSHFGVNWWASQQWKLGLSYGDADLARAALDGNTKMLLFRSQWAYQ
jgi:phosphate-selective porin